MAALIAANPAYLNRVGLTPASLNSIVVLDGPLDMKRFIEAIPSYKKSVRHRRKGVDRSIAAFLHQQLKIAACLSCDPLGRPRRLQIRGNRKQSESNGFCVSGQQLISQ